MATVRTHINKTKKHMKSLGIYKPEFDPVIAVYAELNEQYDELTVRFEASGYQFAESTKAGSKKAPIVTTLESLRKDILAYAHQLGLTPRGLKQFDDAAFVVAKPNALAEMLKKLDSG